MAPAGPGTGPVGSLADAEQAAQRFADPWGLHVGEVMRFDNGCYAELVDYAGNGATEVLIDPAWVYARLEAGRRHGVELHEETPTQDLAEGR